jgi:HNH endonuclease
MSRVSRHLAASVALRSKHRCEYCRLPQEATQTPFHPDHIISIKHGGKASSGNLAWTCFYCNSYKGPCVAGYDPESGRLTRLFNPREDLWNEHFRWRGSAIIGVTAIGRTTILVLNLNHPDRLRLRNQLIVEGWPLRTI